MLSPDAGRSLTWRGFLVVIVGYLVVLRAAGLVFGVEIAGDDPMPTTEAVMRNFVLPIGCTAVYAVTVVTWLGWWPVVVRVDRPVRRWVRFVPVFMVVVALAAINYGNLADQVTSLVLALVCVGVLVGFTEELMFRGIGTSVFRRGGFSEGYVAFWSSLIFGLVHLQNAVGEGPQAIAQAAIVSTTGYFFYLTFRVAGVIWLPMLVHGLWDFSLFSSLVGVDPGASIGLVLPILAQVILVIVVLALRHRTDPVAPPVTQAV